MLRKHLQLFIITIHILKLFKACPASPKNYFVNDHNTTNAGSPLWNKYHYLKLDLIASTGTSKDLKFGCTMPASKNSLPSEQYHR